MTSQDILRQLVSLSNNLGRPEMDYVILGEGNTSALMEDGTFWVKSSGTELRTIGPGGFVRVALDRALAVLEEPELDDAQVKEALSSAKVTPDAPGRPSVETLLHALLLKLEGVRFVGHTHPTVINALTCSVAFPEIFKGRLFPDEIVLCGTAPLLVPYTDPGLPLARHLKKLLSQHLKKHGEAPRIILMQNHGLVALGGSPKQVEDVTAMAVKMARVLQGAYGVGGARYLAPRDVARIHTRPDELYRRRQLGV